MLDIVKVFLAAFTDVTNFVLRCDPANETGTVLELALDAAQCLIRVLVVAALVFLGVWALSELGFDIPDFVRGVFGALG